MASNIPITAGSGTASVATEQIGNNQYQIIKLVGAEAGSTSTLGITPDGSAKVSVVGVIQAFIAGGSIATSAAANQSVSGTIGASVIGTVPVTQGGAFVTSVSGTTGASIIGTVPVVQSGTVITSVAGTVNVSGSVAGWLNSSNASVIGVQQGSVAVAIVSGSIAASFVPPANQSVSGTVQTDVRGSVAVAIISGSIAASFTPPANQSVSGTVGVTGSVAALQGTNPWTVVSSLAGGIFPVSGSVAATITNTNVNVSGSVAAFVVGNASVITYLQAPSIVGTYAEDTAFVQDSKGLFVLGVRNDNLASVTSADLDFSQWAVGPAGENIVANAPITKWVQGTADLRVSQGGSIAVIAAQGASVFTYITGIQVANMGSSSVLVTLSGATSSIIGYTIAPAGGGSNIVYPNALKTSANAAFAASISGAASVLVSAQGFIAKI